MMSKRSLFFAAVLAALVAAVSAAALAQEPQKGSGTPDVEMTDEPLLVFKSFERAWLAGNAQTLANLASDSKVFMEIRGIDRRGGYFTKPQLLFIFKDMFASSNQTSFTFVKYHNLEKQDRRIYGMALRSYKSNRGGSVYQDKVYVTLVKEGPRWAVAEIKSTW